MSFLLYYNNNIYNNNNHIITWKVGRMGPSLPPALVWYVTSEIIIRFFPISRRGCYYYFYLNLGYIRLQ